VPRPKTCCPTLFLVWLTHRSGNVEEIKRLLQAGEQVDTVNKQGVTPLIYAASEGWYPAVQVLLEVTWSPDLEHAKRRPNHLLTCCAAYVAGWGKPRHRHEEGQDGIASST
jgi:hypothetical protein